MHPYGVTEYNESEYLALSGIQHFAFCRRQWALIHIEQIWRENLRTAEGRILHENAHDISRSEFRGELFVSRGMPVFSRTLGVNGECDVVEFRRCSDGIPVSGKNGLYSVYPVEYKRGRPKEGDMDVLQLTAQAMCLEEMFCCEIPEGALFYGEIRRREEVSLTADLRRRVTDLFDEMHRYWERCYLPKPRMSKSCRACSLKEVCLPRLSRLPSATAYNEENLGRKGSD